MDDLEIRVWADLEYELGREPTNEEFELRMNLAIENELVRWHDNLEAYATGN